MTLMRLAHHTLKLENRALRKGYTKSTGLENDTHVKIPPGNQVTKRLVRTKYDPHAVDAPHLEA